MDGELLMRRIILFLVFVCGLAHAQTTFTNFKTGSTSAGTTASTATFTTTAKDIVGCVVSTFQENLLTVVDSLGNNFSITPVNSTGASGHLYMAYFKELGSGSATYSVTGTGDSAHFLTIGCGNFANSANTFVVDVTAAANNAGNVTNATVTIPGVTVTDLIIVGSTNDAGGTNTVGTGYVIPTGGNNFGGQEAYFEYKLSEPTGGNVVANFTQASTSFAIQAVAFKLLTCTSTVCMFPTDTFTESDGAGQTGTATAKSYTWTTPSLTGTPQGNIWNWGMEYCPGCGGLITHAQQDLTGVSPIYSNAIYTYNATTHTFTQNYSGPANSSTCNADSGTTPENRHPYAQHWFNPNDGSYHVISGSCSGGIGYDRIVFTPSGSSGSWTIPSVPGTNPGIRQEGCAQFVPGTDVPSGHDSAYTFSQIGTNLNDTWLIDLSGNSWTEICNSTNNGTPPVCNVPQHGGCALAYDHTVKKLITFGGYSGGTSAGTALSNTTWQLDVTSTTANWVQSNPATDFPASDYPCWGWDSNRRRILVWTNGNQLWSYTTWNNNWLQLTTSGTAPTISSSMWLFSCGYDATTDKFIEMDSNAVVVHELSFNFDGIAAATRTCYLSLMGVC